jgi:hypothetical protein
MDLVHNKLPARARRERHSSFAWLEKGERKINTIFLHRIINYKVLLFVPVSRPEIFLFFLHAVEVDYDFFFGGLKACVLWRFLRWRWKESFGLVTFGSFRKLGQK